MELKVGDTIKYGSDSKDDFRDDIYCEETKNKKKIYFGLYEKNNAISEKKDSLEELLKAYIDSWEEVSIIRNGETFIIKTIDDTLKNAYVSFKRTLGEKTIKILKSKNRTYYTEYENEELVFYKKLNV